MIEGVRLQGVRGERADDFPSFHEGTAEAGVDVAERPRIAGEHAVEGVGEVAVRREPHRARGAEDEVQARMVLAPVAANPGLFRQPVGGERHQVLAVQAQQAGSVGRDDPAHGLEQTVVPVDRRQRGGQVARDFEEGLELLRRSGPAGVLMCSL